MSGNDIPSTPAGGNVRRKPSYSDVLKSTPVSRPTPINTTVTRATSGDTDTASTAASSGLWSANRASLGSGLTAPTPLFSPSIWSPVQDGTQSATIPRKLSWEFKANGQVKAPPTMAKQSPTSTIGLGLQFGAASSTNANTEKAQSTQSPRKNGAPVQAYAAGHSSPYKYKQHDITNAETKPFFRDGGVSLSSTAPLMQRPFYGPGEDLASRYTYGAGEGHDMHGSTGEVTQITNVFNQSPANAQPAICIQFDRGLGHEYGGITSLDGLHIELPDASASDMSFMSEISEHVETADRDAGLKAPMIAEEPHPRSFTRTRMDKSIPFASAYEGADEAISSINPSHFGMGYGSRAVCIKTDFVENIHWSVKTGLWGLLDKVGERTEVLWHDRKGKDDKVLFVFSINGQKSYCGLAEMSGPFTKIGTEIEGFRIKKDRESREWGTIPITWIFIKNVSYNLFRDIDNPNSSTDICNMWNGMHFPSHIAREVIERYVKRPHFTNVLAWRLDQAYDPYKAVLDASQIDPTLGDNGRLGHAMRMIEDGRPARNGYGRGHNTGRGGENIKGNALAVANWRQPQEQTKPAERTTAAIAAAPNRPQAALKQITASSTPPNLDGHTSPRPPQVQPVMCVLDKNGNYVPVSPGGTMSKQPIASSGNSLVTTSSFDQQAKRNNTPTNSAVSSLRIGTQSGNAIRNASMPPQAAKQQCVPGLVGPQVRRIKSSKDLEDPFGTPDILPDTAYVLKPKQQICYTQAMPNHPATTFQRAGSANVVPEQSRLPTSAMAPANQHSGASNNTSGATIYAPGHSGGVSLTPQARREITPSRMPVYGQADPQTVIHNLTTPTGLQIYPSPTDQAVHKSPTERIAEKKSDRSDKSSTEAAKLQEQYEAFLRQQAAISVELMGVKFAQAGLAVPEYLKIANAVSQKGD